MKFSAFAVLPMLALAASAHGQATPQTTPADPQAVDASAAMTAGIDARTGKLRALTDAEVQALSAKAATGASAARARTTTDTHPAWDRIPKTGAEAEKTLRMLPGGISVAELPLTAMHSMTVELDSSGKPRILEGDDTSAHHASQEVSE